MDKLLVAIKQLFCMSRQLHVGTTPAHPDDADIEMQPLVCEEPRETLPPAEPDIGPAADDHAAAEGGAVVQPVRLQDYYCTPVVFRAVEPAPRLHAKLMTRVRSRLPRTSDIFMALNPDLLERSAWLLRANDRSKEMCSTFERHDVLRTWGYAEV